METMTLVGLTPPTVLIIAQLRRDGNYDADSSDDLAMLDHSTTKTGWKL